MIVTLTLMLLAGGFAANLAFRKPSYLVLFLLAAGTLRFGAEGETLPVVTNLSALWLLYLILLCLVTLFRLKVIDLAFSAPEWCYLAFLGWCLFTATSAPSLSYALRVFLKLLLPFLVMLLARHTIQTVKPGTLLLKCVMAAAFAAFLLIGGPTQRFFGAVTWAVSSLFWAVAAFADHAALMSVLALGCWRLFQRNYYLLLCLLLATSSAFSGVRTGIAATAVGLSTFALAEFRMRAVPAVIVFYLAAMSALFFVPEFQERMFFDREIVAFEDLVMRPAQIDLNNVNTSGRATTWEIVLDRFFWPDPLCGSGLGSTQAWFYAGNYGELRVEHSEYVRLLCDVGALGVVLYLIAALVAMVSCWRVFRRAEHPLVRYTGLVGLSMFPAYLICMGFDNVINYTLCCAQYPFALTGVALGLQTGYERNVWRRRRTLRADHQETRQTHRKSAARLNGGKKSALSGRPKP